ncbi:hypothetical protein [Clostridium estertheticum]|uniref:hypothetical protein n=1 Tax=Clostridium estertheticum TaxID=238834 RepID=UPI00124C97E3|nr:hypothetical protein [Clostridium estertheticum]MBZ9616786.1 hypothetical protein [Clostridium estertheticum subsp. laramiense]WAG72493.1 hypothetical protein LL032_15210 [Clostridium estertheticum]
MYKERFKYEYKYNGYAPNFIWSDPKPFKGNLEEMLEHYLKESKERGTSKTEFISRNQESKLALRKSKERKSKEKRNNGE